MAEQAHTESTTTKENSGESKDTAQTGQTTETTTEKMYSEKEFKQVLARAHDAEEKLKNKASTSDNTNTSISEEAIDAKLLKGKGYSDAIIGEMKALAKVRGKTLLDMETDPIIIALKSQEAAETAKKQAALRASGGSDTANEGGKKINDPGLSEEDHKKLWKEQK